MATRCEDDLIPTRDSEQVQLLVWCRFAYHLPILRLRSSIAWTTTAFTLQNTRSCEGWVTNFCSHCTGFATSVGKGIAPAHSNRFIRPSNTRAPHHKIVSPHHRIVQRAEDNSWLALRRTCARERYGSCFQFGKLLATVFKDAYRLRTIASRRLVSFIQLHYYSNWATGWQ